MFWFAVWEVWAAAAKATSNPITTTGLILGKDHKLDPIRDSSVVMISVVFVSSGADSDLHSDSEVNRQEERGKMDVPRERSYCFPLEVSL